MMKLLLPSLAAGALLRANHNATYTVNDKISINGAEIASGSNLDSIIGCNSAPKGATSIEVCGCGVKVEASLLTECQAYSKYTHSVGHCNCGDSSCASAELQSGYTEEFSWEAASFKVVPC